MTLQRITFSIVETIDKYDYRTRRVDTTIQNVLVIRLRILFATGIYCTRTVSVRGNSMGEKKNLCVQL